MCIRDRVTAPTGDPEYFFTTCALDNSVSNNGHYHSDKLEELAKEMGKEFDVEKRSELGIQMQQTVLDDNAYVFCSHLKMSMIMPVSYTHLAGKYGDILSGKVEYIGSGSS